jgi:purine-nucleoside phosphorylase
MCDYLTQVNEAVTYLRGELPFVPAIAMQLGTGLAGIGHAMAIHHRIGYEAIPHFPRSTVAGHEGVLLAGTMAEVPLLVLSGRFHYYEGYDTRAVTMPVRVMQLLGIKTMIIVNAAGGLNPLFAPGTIMVIRDHLNFLGENPLRGTNLETWGERFPDMSEPYHPGLIKLALDSASTAGIAQVVSGVYVCIPGPSLETPSETRWLRGCGADAVGMSSVPEVIVARHGGLDVLGLSVIANVNDPDNFQPISLDEIIAAVHATEPHLITLIATIVAQLPTYQKP